VKFFKNLALKNKLLIFTMGITSVAVIAGFSLIVYRELPILKNEMAREAILASRLTAENCVFSLEFRNTEEATHTLSQLEVLDAFEGARLYDVEGLPFADHKKTGVLPDKPQTAPYNAFNNEYSQTGYLEVYEPVIYRDQVFGVIYLRVSTHLLASNIRNHLWMMSAIMLAALLLTWFLVLRLGPLIYDPIVDLAMVIQKISAEGDYSIRVGRGQGKEIALLYNGFNAMLEEIQLERNNLASFNEALEIKVAERTLQLQESLEALEETNLQLIEVNTHKTRFLSTMSHELRTPLNAILGFSDLLYGQHFGALNEKQLSYVNQIGKSGRHLLDLINDILDVAKIDSGVMELSHDPFSITECAQEMANLIRGQAQGRNIDVLVLSQQDLPQIFADRRKIKQIFLNLLSNALKFTPRDGRIEIRIVREKLTLKISVLDTGVGIEEENQKHLFSEFYQVNRQRDEALGGAGIGLALTRRLVELHEGQIGVKSKPGEGSEFWFRIPLSDAAQPTRLPPEKTEAVQVHGKKILIAEDNATNQALIRDILSIHNHQIAIAKNGKEAVEMARSFQPDLIFMDIRMPLMGGLQATRILRADPFFKELPIIALTASVEPESKNLCIEAGCSIHLSKPIQSREVLDTISRFLKA